MSDQSPPQWLTLEEVAERLRYSTRTIQRYINQGLFGPVLRSSTHSVRISLEAVENFEHDHLEK
jgi:hypothetical protein